MKYADGDYVVCEGFYDGELIYSPSFLPMVTCHFFPIQRWTCSRSTSWYAMSMSDLWRLGYQRNMGVRKLGWISSYMTTLFSPALRHGKNFSIKYQVPMSSKSWTKRAHGALLIMNCWNKSWWQNLLRSMWRSLGNQNRRHTSSFRTASIRAIVRANSRGWKKCWWVLDIDIQGLAISWRVSWQRFSRVMEGGRTPRQVASRVQKYFENRAVMIM